MLVLNLVWLPSVNWWRWKGSVTGNMNHLNCLLRSSWCFWPPLLSHDLISKFLGRVHSFTTVGLEAQATAFSFHADGVVSYLALLPQHNRVSSVEDRAGDITELNAVEAFAAGDHRPGDGYIQRCWIHTHPRFKAFMSSIDIFQMFLNTKTNPSSFGVVISPRDQVWNYYAYT